MTTFDEVVFPEDLSYGSTQGPEYKTYVTTMASGQEVRLPLWPRGRLRVSLSKDLQDSAKKEALIAFFRARNGKARGFRYKDPTDYKAISEIVPQTGTQFLQLVKTYQDAANSEVRVIQKPRSGTSSTKNYTGIRFYKNGILQVTPGQYTVNYTTGVVTVVGIDLTAVYSWSGEFEVPIRFDNDVMELVRPDLYWTWDISLIEELLPVPYLGV